MPKVESVYADGRGGWYFKVTLPLDPVTGRRPQVTKRGFRSAAEAGRARREFVSRMDGHRSMPGPGSLTVNQLLDEYLDGIDADGRLGVKTRYDYRRNADAYIRPHLGQSKVRDVTPQVVTRWQRALAENGGSKSGKGLAPNTIRLARAPLAGAFKLAVAQGLVASNPVASVSRPARARTVPRHWTPEEARRFLDWHDTDREWPIWAFLLAGGLRIGELVALRWPHVDLARRRVVICEFSTTLGYDVVPSSGKSRTSTRQVDLDDGLVAVLERQRALQERERRAPGYEVTEHVFTRPQGGPYHPQSLSQLLGRLSEMAELPRLTAHGLRHTSATLMLDSGVHPKVAAERLGHADPTLFMALYSHVTPTMQRDAADKIGAALFGDRAPG